MEEVPIVIQTKKLFFCHSRRYAANSYTAPRDL